jgi:prepilin-type N-terminal cleavage/methylation domain-containing protein
MKKSGGFTLIELLVVIAIIGIIVAISGVWLFGDRSRFQIREVQTEFAKALDRSRSYVRRYNYSYVLTLEKKTDSTTLKDYYVYNIFPQDASGTAVTDPNLAPKISGRFPDNIIIQQKKPPTALTVIYSAPLSRIGTGAASVCFEIKKDGSLYETSVDLVGVTGKVISRAIIEDKDSNEPYEPCASS